MAKTIPSQMDDDHFVKIRQNVRDFMKYVAGKYGDEGGLLLDIAPQDHEGARPFFGKHIEAETLDIDSETNCTYTADITKHNTFLPDEKYDYIVCTEVLEHVYQPFQAVEEIHRLLKKGGYLFISVPYNFRIHGPLPDCWRFTEHGLRALLSDDFLILELDALETPERPLMPIHYTVVARKKSAFE
jgi:SAM-dependent methyltransferase